MTVRSADPILTLLPELPFALWLSQVYPTRDLHGGCSLSPSLTNQPISLFKPAAPGPSG